MKFDFFFLILKWKREVHKFIYLFVYQFIRISIYLFIFTLIIQDIKILQHDYSNDDIIKWANNLYN